MKTTQFVCGFVLLLFSSFAISADIQHLSFSGGIAPVPSNVTGEIFYTATANFFYNGGAVVLSAKANGTGNTFVDDVLKVRVTHPDGTVATFSHDYSNKCTTGIMPMEPIDISDKFVAGPNQISVILKDKCGGAVSSSSIWLNN